MRYPLLIFFLSLLSSFLLNAQAPGDTIFVQAFDYSSFSRDTVIEFPDANLSYEKIIMKYNMRCKGAQISTPAERNKGCGEWDYSCNTYIVDSTKIEKVASTHPNYIISNNTEDEFHYTNQQLYDYFQFSVKKVEVTDVVSEQEFVPLIGDDGDYSTLETDQNSGRSISLYTAAELNATGLTAGSIDALKWWVVNEGGTAGFLNISIKHTTQETLSNQEIDLTGFTEVFYDHHTFYSGINTTVFANAFTWDGISNILVEVSFTNSSASSPTALQGTTANEVMSLYSNNNYSIDLSQEGRVDILNDALQSIEEQISIAFWSYGDEELLPANTSVLYGWNTNPNNRDLNIHLPWSNSSIFFDCGFSGGYDRISKMANKPDFSGKWNHWTFTKNAATGSMKIYLNGNLWASSTGNNRLINLMHVVLGTNQVGTNNYKGKVNELSIWNTELSVAEIELAMNNSIVESHPSYDNLVAYYPIVEGSGAELIDAKSGEIALGENLAWEYDRGLQLSKGFRETTIRPNLQFVRADYTKSVTIVDELDSLARTPNSVKKYYVVSNEGSLEDDEIVLESTEYYFKAADELVYDGVTGEVLTSIPVQVEGTIEIQPLENIRRFPFYNEIMSFVTPYGIGLDFGENGKSWYFDVSDFTPLLKGKKRINMALGGERQEEMDISFMFIVGTPPRDVLEFNQLWQGTNRTGAARISAINADERYAPMEVPINPDAVSYVLRSTITGHGAEGEFQQNGGAITHYIDIDGDYEENFWSLNQECSENPIYPQGGTWVYDRQGWCPGERSKIEELDVTEFLTPGEAAVFDYGCSGAPNPAGDYRYHIAHQLVSYGAANFDLDASMIDVIAPSNKALYTRLNPICANPVIIVRNTGASDISSLEIEYWVNDAASKEVFLWEGDLDFMETTEITLPTGASFNQLNNTNNTFHAEITKVNGQVDEYSFNNTYESQFDMVKVIPDQFVIVVRTNLNSSENSYQLLNDQEEVLLFNNLPNPNKIYRDTFDLSGCFKMTLNDNGDDGLAWWANPAQGTGYAQIRDLEGNVLHDFNADFGGGFIFSFVTESYNRVEDPAWASNIKLYPNPATTQLSVTGIEKDDRLAVYDAVGRIHQISRLNTSEIEQLDIASLPVGIYFLKIDRKSTSTAIRFVKM